MHLPVQLHVEKDDIHDALYSTTYKACYFVVQLASTLNVFHPLYTTTTP